MRRTATAALQTRAPESRVIFAPRTYQRRVQEAWRAGGKRLVTVWHRRAGKDVTWLAITLEALLRRPGLYFHVFPTFAQGRDALWIATSPPEEGEVRPKRHLEIFPRELVASVNETEMQVRFTTGAIWQIMGADHPDSLRGTNPLGVVFSGWAAYDRARWDAAWFADRKTIRETRRDGVGESGAPVIAEAVLDEKRREGWPEEEIAQEYLCSFDASLVGAYYGDQLRAAEADGRVTRVPWEPTVPCVTAWDLGYDDATAIWVVQAVGRELRVLDYLEAQGEFVPYFAKQLKTLEYVYGEHLLPHDAAAENIRAEQTIEGQLRALGIRPTRIVPKAPVETGIQAVRALFPRLVFDAARCRLGLERLAAYRKRKDQQTQEYRGAPVHDVASDAADALRTLAMGLRRSEERRVGEEG